MEGAIARWYDKSTRKDMERFRALAARLRTVLPQGGDMLEVAPGPGFVAIEMARSGAYRVTGLDVSHTMVELARRNATEAGVKVDFHQGNVSAMPFPDDSFDLLACSAAFKNSPSRTRRSRRCTAYCAPAARQWSWIYARTCRCPRSGDTSARSGWARSSAG